MACRVVPLGLSRVCRADTIKINADIGRAGDHAVSRAPFHIIIALCAGPRFLVLILQWLAHRHTAVKVKSNDYDGALVGQTTARASRSKAEHRKAEEMVDTISSSVREAVEGGANPPPPPLADIELVVGIARTFCW